MTAITQPHQLDNPELESVATNAIGFEMFRHLGTHVREDGVEVLDHPLSLEELERCRAAAKRALAHVHTFQSEGFTLKSSRP